MKLNDILQGYLETALWSSTDEDGEPLDGLYNVRDCADSFKSESMEDVKGFLAYCNETGISLRGIDSWKFGMDFWLSRNGHGAGFFDRGIEPRWSRLQEAARVFGSVDLFVNDSGEVTA